MKNISLLLLYIAHILLLCGIHSASAQPIAGGGFHSIFLCSTGSPMACGRNMEGELGDGTDTVRWIPVQVIGINSMVAVEAGIFHSIYLKKDGTVWACGGNFNGQLGDGTVISKTIPLKINNLTGIEAIAGGGRHSLFLKNDGTVWACGENTYGQLGDGTTIERRTPIQAAGLSGIVAVAGGSGFSLFLKDDGTVWACGENAYGQLGDGTNTSRNVPIGVIGMLGIVDVAAGADHSLFLKNDGTVWACGNNNAGQLGDGTSIARTIPVAVLGLTGILAFEAGEYHSLFLKNDGSVWACGNNTFGQLGDGTNNATNIPIQIPLLSGIRAIAAGNLHSLFLKSDSTVWTCGSNGYGQLADGTNLNTSTPVEALDFCTVAQPQFGYAHVLHGYLFDDVNDDCNMQSSEPRLPPFSVVATPGYFFTFTNDTGYYSLGVYDSVNYTIAPIIPQRFYHMLKNPCPANYSVYLDAIDSVDTSGFDFGFDANLCHQLRVDVSSNRRRRCFRNYTTVYYVNEGLATANGVEVSVTMGEYDIPISASLPYTYDAASNTLIFTIGTLDPGQGGLITIIDSIACIQGITGLTQCTRALILPPNQCLLDSTEGPGWDKSSIKVEGECVNDTVRFVIYNVGSGDMTAPSEYRIYADNVLQQTGTFQLASGDSLVITVVSGGATIRLEADQHPDHPGNSHPRETVEACGTSQTGTFSTGEVDNAPQDDEDIDIEIDCMEIRDSYDPNAKVVSPEGVGAGKIVLPNTSLGFIIHFQNTGTDTAYKVVITDLLPAVLDLSTLEPGASSHPYKLNISGEGRPMLTFTFDNINLVDSFTNEPLSHGFVKFRIAPYSNTPLGTQVTNNADIYFDFNAPVKTNTVAVTIGNYPVSIRDLTNNTLGGEIVVFPNPSAGKIVVRIQSRNSAGSASGGNSEFRSIEIYNMFGENIYSSPFPMGRAGNGFIDLSDHPAGIYLLKLSNEKSVEVEKFILER